MDDSCAVCAETLEWVAYGPCGHREVCSTCIIRLRFICNDRCCCICKSESKFIFVTKALGDYTMMINDFSALPSNPIEGKIGDYWFHEGAQAYFDDVDHFKIMEAMCRLSCNVCEEKNGTRKGESKRSGDFNNIEQLKIHLFQQHKLFMCSLCLEGRKIFICEQKLYNRAQLNQHLKTGDSVVDGRESERGGFTGHPMCKFCQNPFYGDNELYLHMSTEHFTCHICQRQHPGKYEYYDGYDDLETHFRQQHFLCEDEACLAKKFIVFASESEMKRHDAVEHKGNMSRSKRNAALQIPISFQYQQPSELDRRGRRNRVGSNSSNIQLNMAIQDSLETFNTVRPFHIPSCGQSSSHREAHQIGSTVNPYELLACIDIEPYSGLGQSSSSALLEESSFPPLPVAPSSSKRKLKKAAGSGNTMAARLRNHNTVRVLNTSRASPATVSHNTSSSVNVSCQSRPVLDSGVLSSSSSASSSAIKPTNSNKCSLSSHASSSQSRTSALNDLVLPLNLASSSTIQSSRIGHSSQPDKTTTSSQPLLKVDGVGSANKVLIEKVRAALNFDEDKFAAFKLISTEYRQDLIGTGEYLAYVHQFGLEHLVLELSLLCPNAQKQRELVEIYNTSNKRNGSSSRTESGGLESGNSSKKGKEKCGCNHSSEKSQPESLNRKVMDLQLNLKQSMKEANVLNKDACHPAKGKSKVLVEKEANRNSSIEPGNGHDAQSATSKKNVAPRKKGPKFLRNRIGDASASTLTESSNADTGSSEKRDQTHWKKDPPEMLPIHGVWQNGGGQKLVAMTQRYSKK